MRSSPTAGAVLAVVLALAGAQAATAAAAAAAGGALAAPAAHCTGTRERCILVRPGPSCCSCAGASQAARQADRQVLCWSIAANQILRASSTHQWGHPRHQRPGCRRRRGLRGGGRGQHRGRHHGQHRGQPPRRGRRRGRRQRRDGLQTGAAGCAVSMFPSRKACTAPLLLPVLWVGSRVSLTSATRARRQRAAPCQAAAAQRPGLTLLLSGGRRGRGLLLGHRGGSGQGIHVHIRGIVARLQQGKGVGDRGHRVALASLPPES